MSAPARRPIRRLERGTVHRIAAGEVVERPASVVKELIENAFDAGASHVAVRIEEGGLRRIEVADDGCGIPPEELGLALERHATSKIGPSDPIERIASLGFRGEALASIATVSRLRLTSRTPDREEASGIATAGGEQPLRFEEGRSVGTTVEVADLFYNTPARRKFLHAPAVEQLEVLRAVEHLYVARPSVALRLTADGREIAGFPASEDLREATAHVLGAEMLDQSFVVEAELPGLGRIRGVLGRPNLATGSPRRFYLSVNGRTIESRAIAQAIRAAYLQYIPRTRFPIGALHLAVPLDRVDVNVHPTKREVRFARETELVEAVRIAVRRALLDCPGLARVPEIAATVRRFSPEESLEEGFSTRSESPLGPWPARTAPLGSRSVGPGAAGQRRLFERPDAPTLEARPGLPAISLLGVLDALYWVGTTPTGFVLIDQHAASERLLFEVLVADGHLARQVLVDPLTISLTPAQRAAWEVHRSTVADAGFDVEPFGGDRVRVLSVPAYRGHRARAESVRELLEELSTGTRPTQPDGMVERVAATIACHAAIRAGDAIPPDELARVLDALYERASAVYSCPHGRPILFDLPRSRIDRWFLRAGP